MVDEPQSEPRWRTSTRMWIALAGLVIVLVLVAVVVALRSRSDYPGSAKGSGQAANGVPLANKHVQMRAEKFVDLLNAGEVGKLQTLTYSAQDADTAADFVSAYGNRRNTVSETRPANARFGWESDANTLPFEHLNYNSNMGTE